MFPPCFVVGREFLYRIGIMKFHRCHAVKPFLVASIIVKIDVVLYCKNEVVSVVESA